MSDDASRETYVYFFENPQTGLVKIGYSGNPVQRLRQLSSDARVRLNVLGFTPGGRKLEATLHRDMAEYREHGEWFRPNPWLTNLINLANDLLRINQGSPDRARASLPFAIPDPLAAARGYWGEWLEVLA